MSVKVQVQDKDGNILKEFLGEDGFSFHEMAEKNDVEIPIACGAGACLVCAVEVVEGKQYVQNDKKQPPLVDVEDNQTLTCISGIHEEFLQDTNDNLIILKKIL